MIVYWIAATYVLADVYSAQLTSQFARPAREPPINTLQRLQYAMNHNGYQLFVEKESSSLEMLEVISMRSSVITESPINLSLFYRMAQKFFANCLP